MQFSRRSLLDFLIYFALLTSAVYILSIGPIFSIIKRETTFIQSFQVIEELSKPIEWPALVICKLPREKNRTKYHEFMQKGYQENFASEDQFHEYLDEVFYTNHSELIEAISIGNAYLKVVERATTRDIPAKPPFVYSTFIDFLYLGYCATVSLEALRSFMVLKGEVSDNDIDSNFITMVFLKGMDDEHSQYLFKFLPEDETVRMISPESSMTSILPGTANIFTLNFNMRKRLKQCNESISRMSPCVENVYEELYGEHFNAKVKRNINMTDAIFAGYDTLETITGCQRPCEYFEYSVDEYVRYHHSVAMDGSKKILDESGNGSSVIIINHLKYKTMKKYEEVSTYTAISFISDVGGILGIFLGLSFWSLYCLFPKTEILKRISVIS